MCSLSETKPKGKGEVLFGEVVGRGVWRCWSLGKGRLTLLLSG